MVYDAAARVQEFSLWICVALRLIYSCSNRRRRIRLLLSSEYHQSINSKERARTERVLHPLELPNFVKRFAGNARSP